MCENNGKPFIDMLYNVLLAPDLCNIIFNYYVNEFGTYPTLKKGFCTLLFIGNEQNAVKLTQNEQRKHASLVKMKEKSKLQNKIPKNKASLGLLNQILGHIFIRSLLDGDTENVWKYIELNIDPDPL